MRVNSYSITPLISGVACYSSWIIHTYKNVKISQMQTPKSLLKSGIKTFKCACGPLVLSSWIYESSSGKHEMSLWARKEHEVGFCSMLMQEKKQILPSLVIFALKFTARLACYTSALSRPVVFIFCVKSCVLRKRLGENSNSHLLSACYDRHSSWSSSFI